MLFREKKSITGKTELYNVFYFIGDLKLSNLDGHSTHSQKSGNGQIAHITWVLFQFGMHITQQNHGAF